MAPMCATRPPKGKRGAPVESADVEDDKYPDGQTAARAIHTLRHVRVDDVLKDEAGPAHRVVIEFVVCGRTVTHTIRPVR